MPASEAEIEGALPVVRQMAGAAMARGVPAGLSFDDLVSAGQLEVVKAARNFDPAGPAPFTGYASRAIRDAIAGAVNKQAQFNSREGSGRVGQVEDGEATPLVELFSRDAAPDPCEQAEDNEEVACMTRAGRRRVFSVARARAESPTLAAVGEAVARLRLAVFDSITEADVREMMRVLVDKAKGGDLGAMKLLLGHLTGRGQGVTVQQAVIVGGEQGDD